MSARREPDGEHLESIALVGLSRQWPAIMDAARWHASRHPQGRVFVRLRPATLLPHITMADLHLTSAPPARL